MLYKIRYTLIGLLLLGQMAACKKDDIAPAIDRTTVPRTIGEFVKNNYDLSILYAALVKTGLLDSLNRPDAGTFFAPDNAAFNYMGIASPADVERMDTDSLRFALQGHMLNQRFFVSQFPVQMGNAYTAKSGRTIYVSVARNTNLNTYNVTINGCMMQYDNKRDIGLANGVVHLIAKPVQYRNGTVQDFIAADTSLSVFAAAMKRFGYWDGLKNNDPITVFAPNNGAFAKKGITADSVARMDPDAFREELFSIYHFNLTPKRVFASDGAMIYATALYYPQGLKIGIYSVAPNYTYSQYNNTQTSSLNVYIPSGSSWTSNPDGVTVSYYVGRSVRYADYLTENGVVHIIEDLFLYPEKLKK